MALLYTEGHSSGTHPSGQSVLTAEQITAFGNGPQLGEYLGVYARGPEVDGWYGLVEFIGPLKTMDRSDPAYQNLVAEAFDIASQYYGEVRFVVRKDPGFEQDLVIDDKVHEQQLHRISPEDTQEDLILSGLRCIAVYASAEDGILTPRASFMASGCDISGPLDWATKFTRENPGADYILVGAVNSLLPPTIGPDLRRELEREVSLHQRRIEHARKVESQDISALFRQ